MVALLTFSFGTLVPTNAMAATTKKVAEKSLVAPYNQTTVVTATNAARSAQKLRPLAVNSALTRAAQAKANDMVKNGYFSHVTPTGVQFWEFITNEGYNYLNAGENLAANYQTLDGLMNAWLASPGHRANIMGAQYTEVGVGFAYGERNGKKGWFVVSMFGSR